MATRTQLSGMVRRPFSLLLASMSRLATLPSTATAAGTTAPAFSSPGLRTLHTTPTLQKRQAKAALSEYVVKARAFKKSIYGPPPAPLRMARNRALRHWTIHRAWMLWCRQRREAKERELRRMYQSMERACEELRTVEGPDGKGEGYLYRVAMEKKGVYGPDGVPIEYARHQTETPPRAAWNHEWKRG